MNSIPLRPPSAVMIACIVGTLVGSTLAGCNNAKLRELADKAKQAATEGADKVSEQVTEQVESATTEAKEQLQLAGEIKLTLDQPMEAKACYARFISLGAERPKVFQLRSYSTPEKESPPSIFFHAQTDAAALADLTGQVVSGRLFVQPAVEGPTWYSAPGTPVELKITGREDELLVAEIVSASLRNTETDAVIAATGTFRAIQQ